MDTAEIIKQSYDAFSSFKRPKHFTNYKHCEECAEHDETMLSCQLSNLGPNEVGQPCWSPLPFLTEKALGYVMPRLIELAVSNSPNKDGDSFIFDFLLTITPNKKHDRFASYNKDQCDCIRNALQYIYTDLHDVSVEGCFEEELKNAIKLWGK